MVAFFLSGVFPGLGQFYNRQPLKGGAFLVAGIALSWLIGRMVPTDLMALASASVGIDAILLLCLLLAIWLWSGVHGLTGMLRDRILGNPEQCGPDSPEPFHLTADELLQKVIPLVGRMIGSAPQAFR